MRNDYTPGNGKLNNMRGTRVARKYEARVLVVCVIRLSCQILRN